MFFAAVILYLAAAFQAAIFWFGINARVKAALQRYAAKKIAGAKCPRHENFPSWIYFRL